MADDQSGAALVTALPVPAGRFKGVANEAARSRVLTLVRRRSARSGRSYRIGEVEVTLRSAFADVADAFHSLYSRHALAQAPRGAVQIDVDRCWTLRGRPAYRIRTDGEDRFFVRRRRSVLPHVEWAINAAVAAMLPARYQVHAGAVARDGVALILPAHPQSGKSTLVAGLVKRGWDYLSDEFALIDPASLRLVPYPKALCIKEGSFDALEQCGIRLDGCPAYDKGAKGRVRLLDVQRIRAHATPWHVPVGMVVFPRYADRPAPVIRPMSQALALFQLLNVSFTFARFRAQALAILGDTVERAACFQLESGDLQAACEAIDELWREHVVRTDSPAFDAHSGAGTDATREVTCG